MNLVSYQNAPVKVFHAEIGDSMEPCVDGRELHGFLESGRDFPTWINERVEKYGFTEDQEFSTNLGKTSEDGGRPRKEYTITVEMAKELCMVENNAKGREIRRYFITVEREAKKQIASLEQNQTALTAELTKKIVSEHKAKKSMQSLEELALDSSVKPETIDRMVKVAALRKRGLQNQMIAQALGLPIGTVENIASKLIGMGAIEPLAYSKQAALFGEAAQ